MVLANMITSLLVFNTMSMFDHVSLDILSIIVGVTKMTLPDFTEWPHLHVLVRDGERYRKSDLDQVFQGQLSEDRDSARDVADAYTARAISWLPRPKNFDFEDPHFVREAFPEVDNMLNRIKSGLSADKNGCRLADLIEEYIEHINESSPDKVPQPLAMIHRRCCKRICQEVKKKCLSRIDTIDRTGADSVIDEATGHKNDALDLFTEQTRTIRPQIAAEFKNELQSTIDDRISRVRMCSQLPH